ncbi:protein DDI1 homolog 2-like isoform X2 [Anneissia japonica]|uniref:protein DDI1 homolog 2-like isoform X2 n=1 Tax=Anneissia japonica TaxID=1529436 RepID=UPI00142576D5|nr:protein DDI1 homolog 2-like isoform X2 [Anneissia japonica]
MKVLVTSTNGQYIQLDVSPDIELENFKALCEIETGVNSQEIRLIHAGKVLEDNNKTLEQYGVKDSDMILLQPLGESATRQQRGAPAQSTGIGIDFSRISVPGASNQLRTPQPRVSQPRVASPTPAVLRDSLLANPDQVALLKQRNPRLADALLSGSLDQFTTELERQRREQSERDREHIRMATADPMDPSAQEKIAETIKQNNIDANMEVAMEHAPESFGQVIMLYIDCKVNGHPVKAFVDSGAQMTIMSAECAKRCNIMRLVDKRWAGIAKGVGVQKIIGRVHLGQIQIGPDFLQSSFSILEDQPMDMLLGLDMLRRHQCSIDLEKVVLRIGTTGTETPFLSEAELPPSSRLNRSAALGDSVTTAEDRDIAEALSKSVRESTGEDSSRATFSDSDIKKITDAGFSREDAIAQLQSNGGDVSLAIAALLAKSLKVPGQ